MEPTSVTSGVPPLAGVTGSEFAEAVAWASELHAGETRRGGRAPYLAHLLAVAALVLEDGGDEVVAVAAVLHDAAEHGDAAARLDMISDRFGSDVVDIVRACTDASTHLDPAPSTSWGARKLAYLDSLRASPPGPEALRVLAADKLDNARMLAMDLRQRGAEAWSTFDAEPDEVVAYYRGMAELIEARLPDSRSGRELVAVARRLEADLVEWRSVPLP